MNEVPKGKLGRFRQRSASKVPSVRDKDLVSIPKFACVTRVVIMAIHQLRDDDRRGAKLVGDRARRQVEVDHPFTGRPQCAIRLGACRCSNWSGVRENPADLFANDPANSLVYDNGSSFHIAKPPGGSADGSGEDEAGMKP